MSKPLIYAMAFFFGFVCTGMVCDTLIAIAKIEAPAAPTTPDPDGFRLLTRITDLERELGHREAELDALTDQLDSAVAEMHTAGALLKKHGIEYSPETLDLETR